MVHYIDMYTRSKKGIKMKMDTTMGFYGKGMKLFFSICSM
jgi:hypothetical protein